MFQSLLTAQNVDRFVELAFTSRMDHQDFELINVADAQERLEELVDLLLSGEAKGFILCRNGKPCVQLLPLA